MSEKESKDLVKRGQYGSSPLATTVFVGLRALDGLIIQRALQVLNPLPALLVKLGFDAPPPAPSGGLPLAMSDHALTPFQAIVWGMSVATSVKHIVWMLYTSKEQMDVSAAVLICVFNTVLNSMNTMAFSLAAVNPTWSSRVLYASIPIFATGLVVETYAEFQRKWFKDDPKNKGKPFSGGLFAYARSINYFGYTLWRGAMAMATGGPVWGAFVAGFFSYDFTSRAIPMMDEYCSKRYGAQWEQVKKKVPYGFCPGVC